MTLILKAFNQKTKKDQINYYRENILKIFQIKEKNPHE